MYKTSTGTPHFNLKNIPPYTHEKVSNDVLKWRCLVTHTLTLLSLFSILSWPWPFYSRLRYVRKYTPVKVNEPHLLWFVTPIEMGFESPNDDIHNCSCPGQISPRWILTSHKHPPVDITGTSATGWNLPRDLCGQSKLIQF